MEPHRITESEKNSLTDSACELFKLRNPDYWPSKINAEKLVGFVERNLGMTLAEYPYPVTVDVWQDCYNYLLEHDFVYSRPEEPEVVDEAAAVEARKQQKVRDDYDARQRAEKIQRDRNMPLQDLGKLVSVQNADLRAVRETSGLPVRQPGTESQRMDAGRLGIQARARIATGNAHPELAVDSQGWNKVYALELARLRG